MLTLKHQTVSGIKWLVTSSFLQKAISFIATIVLARILSPSIFGLYSLAFIAIDGLTMFKSMGFDTALIRKSDNVEKAANTAFFIIPILGILIYLILAFSAPIIGEFLNNKEVPSVIRALGIIYIISCFGRVPAAILEKNMQFKKISIIEISTAVIYTITAILLAVSGVGIWSLVIAYIAKTIFQNIMFWISSKWHPRFEFDKKVAFEMFHFGKFIFLGSLAWFLRMNLDNLLVGKLLGVAALGLYGIAFSISNLCSDYFGSKVQRVVFPAYSKLQNNIEELKEASLKVLKHVSLVAFPIGIGLFVLSEEFLGVAYGKKWLGAATILKILAWGGIFNTLPLSFNGVFLACGKPRLTLWITLMQIGIFSIFIMPSVRMLGINGAGIVVTSSSLIAFLLSLFLFKKIMNIKMQAVYSSMRPVLIASILMGLGVFSFKRYLTGYFLNNNLYLNSIFLFSVAAILYIYSLFIIDRDIFLNFKGILFKKSEIKYR